MTAPRKFREWKLHDIDPSFVEECAKHVKGGATYRQTAKIMGVPWPKFAGWLKTGAEQVADAYETGQLGRMVEREAALWRACGFEAGTRGKTLAKHVMSGADEWRAALAYLERTDRDDFGQTDHIDVTIGGSDVPIALEGRPVVTLGDVVRLAIETGQGHLAGFELGGNTGRGLPAPRDVLPDPADGEPTAGPVPPSTD